MTSKIINKLIVLSDLLDKHGYTVIANKVDDIIKIAATTNPDGEQLRNYLIQLTPLAEQQNLWPFVQRARVIYNFMRQLTYKYKLPAFNQLALSIKNLIDEMIDLLTKKIAVDQNFYDRFFGDDGITKLIEKAVGMILYLDVSSAASGSAAVGK